MHGLRLLADDLTGALDSASAFDLEVPVHLDKAPANASAPVVGVATSTRDVCEDELPDRLEPLIDWLAGADLAFKKVDSLLRGNTFAECAHLARAGRFDRVVFAPAFPAQRRLTVSGQQYIGPPHDDAQVPRKPVGPPIVDAFARRGLACRTTSDASPQNLGSPRTTDGGDPMVWVPDIRGEGDLLAVAEMAERVRTSTGSPAQRWLWCGSAGLAQAFARTMGIPVPPADATSARQRPQGSGSDAMTHPVLMLGASHHPVTRNQWVRLRQALPQAVTVREGDAAELASACAALEHRGAFAALELAPRQPLTPEQAAALLKAQLSDLVRCIRKPSVVFVIGGDTLLGLCRATGVESLVTQRAIRAGWGYARFIGGCWDGLICHSRSGAFGDEWDLQGVLFDALGDIPRARWAR